MYESFEILTEFSNDVHAYVYERYMCCKFGEDLILSGR